MLRTCSSILLLSGVPRFVQYVSEVARDAGAEINSYEDWNVNYRINEDIVICGSKYLSCINTSDYKKVRLVLKTDETVTEFIKMGITHFIFDYNNVRELAFSFFVSEEDVKETLTITNVISKADKKHYVKGRYDFNFETDSFKYEGVGIYLRKCEKLFLAEWLLLGKKDNSKRSYLCSLRKKFGKTFLADVDRYGSFKEGV